MGIRALFLSVVMVLCACASSNGVVRPSTPFSAQDQKLFDDGADLLGDPDALEGKWGVDWDTEMRGRVQSSDIIAVVAVTTLRTDVDPQGHTTYRIVVEPSHVWKGKIPPDGLTLSVKEGAIGYATIDQQKQNILNTSFIAFVKWYETPEGTVDAHWHMSIATEPVVRRVRTHMEQEAPTHDTIIQTHVNKAE